MLTVANTSFDMLFHLENIAWRLSKCSLSITSAVTVGKWWNNKDFSMFPQPGTQQRDFWVFHPGRDVGGKMGETAWEYGLCILS